MSLEKEKQQRQQQQQQLRQKQKQTLQEPVDNGKQTGTKSSQAHHHHPAEQNGAGLISSSAARKDVMDPIVDRTGDLHLRDGSGGLFAALYPNLPEEDGLQASRNERLANGYRSITLTYGEVSASGFSDILAVVRDSYGGLPEEGGVFVDLGCGTGKPVFAAAAAHPWHRCIGVEILGDLHSICQKALERWEGGLKNAVTVGGSKGATAEVEFVCGDFTVLDWSDGDVVFANSTCFDDDLMKKTAAAVAALKEGAIVITTTDPVPSPALEILEETVMVQAGRSATTCFIQRRLPKAPPAFGPV